MSHLPFPVQGHLSTEDVSPRMSTHSFQSSSRSSTRNFERSRACGLSQRLTKIGILQNSRKLSEITEMVCHNELSHSRANIGSTELSSDPTIRSHLAALYDTLLEQNLLRIVEPYSVVEIDHVAQQVGQGRQSVEAK